MAVHLHGGHCEVVTLQKAFEAVTGPWSYPLSQPAPTVHLHLTVAATPSPCSSALGDIQVGSVSPTLDVGHKQ